ncbi:type II toxin-antitoxin system Phd/YefM family antitoxin [Desulfonatronum parangueonense]
MLQVNVEEHDTEIFRLMQAALAGEDVLLARSGKPLVRLTPLVDPLHQTTGYKTLTISHEEIDGAFSDKAEREVAELFFGRDLKP